MRPPAAPRPHAFRASILLSILSAFLPSAFHASSARASTGFSEDFRSTKGIAQSDRVFVDPGAGAVSLPSGANTLLDRDTLLFTHLDSDGDVASPTIARGGGGAAAGVTYSAGHEGGGEAAVFAGRGARLMFPASGNWAPLKGTIDFWLSLPRWRLDAQGHTSSHPHTQAVFHASDDGLHVLLARHPQNGEMVLEFARTRSGVYSRGVPTGDFTDGSWHHFTFVWNVEEDSFYVATWVDGVYQHEMADPAPNTFEIGDFRSFRPHEFYVGNDESGKSPLNGALDELRISGAELSATDHPFKAGLLTSTAFDTQVQEPVWGRIQWSATLPPKTDVELQTSTSADGESWSSWFRDDRAMATLTFDDGYQTTYTAAHPVMRGRGFPGVAYITTDWVGKPNYMTVEQLQELQRAGWEIGGHGSDHFSSRQSFADSKAWLERNGLGHDTFAYPGGYFDPDLVSTIAEYYRSARTIINQYQTHPSRYALYSYAGNSEISDLRSWIDSVVEKKAWGILTFHSIGQPKNPGDVSLAHFTDVTDYLSESDIDVLTVKDALAGLGLYTNSGGEAIVSPSRRYIRYRAILHTFDASLTPALSAVRISTPTTIYRGIPVTIGSNGTFDHETWPQVTDSAIHELTVAPTAGSVRVAVEAWGRSGPGRKAWTESGLAPGAGTHHTIGNLVPGNSYQVAGAGAAPAVLRADASGRISFESSRGPSSASFAVEQTTPGPTISDLTTIPTPAGATIRWKTAERSSSAIDYGPTVEYGSSTAEADAPAGVVEHAVALSGLEPCTTYHVRARSRGQDPNAGVSEDATVTTTGICHDSVRRERDLNYGRTIAGKLSRIAGSVPWPIVIATGLVVTGILLLLVVGRKKRAVRRPRRRRRRRSSSSGHRESGRHQD